MANAYILSAPFSPAAGDNPGISHREGNGPDRAPPIAVFNHIGRAFADTFAMLYCERPAEQQELSTEDGLLRVDGVGLVEADDVKRLFRNSPGTTVTLVDPSTGTRADLTYFIVS